jgi:hypothetical protein
VVRPYDAGPQCARGSGRYLPNTRYVEVDPAVPCIDGYLALRRAAGHELMHWLTSSRWHWLGHICAASDPGADCHPTIRAPDALLAPGLHRAQDTGPGWDEAYVPAVAEPAPTDADLALVRALAGP